MDTPVQPTSTFTLLPTSTYTATPIPLKIESAGANPNPFDAHKGLGTTINFMLSKTASVDIVIDKKNGGTWILLRQGFGGQMGINQIVWDGKNDTGQIPPPGQDDYTVIVTAKAGMETVQATFDITVLP